MDDAGILTLRRLEPEDAVSNPDGSTETDAMHVSYGKSLKIWEGIDIPSWAYIRPRWAPGADKKFPQQLWCRSCIYIAVRPWYLKNEQHNSVYIYMYMLM